MTSQLSWSFPRLLLFRAFLLFTILFIISFSFGYTVIPDPGNYLHRLFEIPVRWTGDHIFHIQQPYTVELFSDSTGFYLNAFNIFVFSLLLSIVWTLVWPGIRSHDQLLYFFTAFVRYYLSLQLFVYGFSKVFKVQFYLPEPNILYTPLGNVPRDLLYWSTMGVSRTYSMFLGITELVAAFLLLFRRTAFAGSLFAAFILINITLINFAYDIDVKLLSCFLLLQTMFLLIVNRRRISYLFGGETVSLSGWEPARQGWIYPVSKTIMIVLLLTEGLSPYIKAGNYNDDKMPRPYLHGAYDVKTFILNNDTLAPLLTDTIRWKRVFFHRRNYMIIEKMNDAMLDDKIECDTSRKEINIMRYGSKEEVSFSYEVPDSSTLVMEGNLHQNHLKVILHKIDLKQLPLLRKEFHWTIDN